jgi:hypothetical protein
MVTGNTHTHLAAWEFLLFRRNLALPHYELQYPVRMSGRLETEQMFNTQKESPVQQLLMS